MKSVTKRDIEKMVTKMKNSHSFGRDRIDAITIKLAAPILIPVLTHVGNLSLGTGKFPAKWKLARILPLLKSKESDTNDPASYRPISLLPLISKICERAVQVQLVKYLEETHQLHENHHTYRSRLSTTTELIQIMDGISLN